MKDLNEVMSIMNTISYGWMDINDNVHIGNIDNLKELYRVATIEEILNNKIGICFDQVELERHLIGNEYLTKSYAIITNHMVHAFLTLQKDNDYIYFEHSSYGNEGIYHFDNMDSLLEAAVEAFMKTHHLKHLKSLKLVSYSSLQSGTTFNEIEDILLNESVKIL